jgi:hypothetical protein
MGTMGARHAGGKSSSVNWLSSAIGVEDLWLTLAQGALQGFDAEARIERIRQRHAST